MFPSGSRSPRNLSDLIARTHSPVAEDAATKTHTIDSVAWDIGTPEKKDGGGIHSEEMFGLPTFRFRPLSIGMSAKRPSTSPVSASKGVAEIVSPRPERPTSSESRKMFSKILDMDHNPTSELRGTRTLPRAPTFKLEPVNEMSSPTKTPRGKDLDVKVNDKSTGKTMQQNTEAGSRWSGVTSLEHSTVDSLLDRHIECLGLKREEQTQSDQSSASTRSSCDLKDDDTVTGILNGPRLNQLNDHNKHEAPSLRRPTSLSSLAQEQLMPRRLFASLDRPAFPLASSDSDARFSLAWTDDKSRPSYGWIPLPSASKIMPEPEKSRQTLMSGEYADIESHAEGQTGICNDPSADVSPTTELMDPTESAAEHNTASSPYLPRDRARVSRQTSRQRHKMRLRLKTPTEKPDASASDDWISTDERTDRGDTELVRLGMTRVPVSAVDGFAELSGDSANASLRSLTSILNAQEKPPEAWSSVVSAMPIPSTTRTGLRKKDSVRTAGSQKSKRSIADPINNTKLGSRRQSHEIRAQSSVPQLARPDLGPSMRASQFDLSSGCRIKSPVPKLSSFSEPEGLLEGSPPKQHGHKGHRRRRFHSLRHIMPGSTRGSLSPFANSQHQHFIVSQSCRGNVPAGLDEKNQFPETVAMSDFAYQKHKLLERFRDWCGRRCFGRKRRTVPPGGFLV